MIEIFGFLKKRPPFWKVIVTDIFGVLLIITAVLFGWLPGPGGIPLFLAGLGLLSINHRWAKRLLIYLKEKGIVFFEKFFTEHPVVKQLIDIFAILIVITAIYVLYNWSHDLIRAFAVSSTFGGTLLFLLNRGRLAKILQFLYKKK